MPVDARRLSCPDFAFPALELEGRLELIRLLGFAQVDLELVVPLPPAAPEDAVVARMRAAVSASNLRVADLFFVVGGDDFAASAINHVDAALRAAHRVAFAGAARAARELGAPGLTVLPGVPDHADPAAGWERAVEELRWRVDAARAEGVQTRIEAHIGSLVSTPELAARIVAEVPGLALSLDPTHFTMQAIAPQRITPLAPLAGHVHLRASRPGDLQVAWERDEGDLAGLLAALEAAGYEGPLCVEYVPMAKWNCDRMDILGATAATRAALLSGELG
ncbi:sugar phosphate isomerase/epimerase family protein [Conexibacter arvalis]|uniref:Sugar phosphate isomerase/epimerase n=1 Tax=Conexibacter arvalis TaxID=912552 RepID=A0A840IJB5_9ACTN|nr:TIM barrel protein [Conexibacter arvalis]MBB4664846.1 sugar phosphate isomerase/epimerase [Conexibacter arvalis]